ncbi:MAG TPA: antibiotic biosynthesis monooxygenase [Candidatus Dormibacteraeota bacterium]|nr:antibiotic biosynthesis monooxygenase [Candidatus Dormibacteraeota bacterium]
MFIRGTRVQTPPDQIDAAIANFKQKVLPTARSTPGNVGAALLVDRKTGAGVGITYWESAKALAASEQMGIQARTQAVKNVSGSEIVNVERFEVVIMDRAAPPKEGTFSRVNGINADPDKVDALTVFIRNQALPVIKAQKGYRACIMAVDRQTGRCVVSTGWDTLADLQASEPKVTALRQEAGKTAGASGAVEVEIFEAASLDLAQVPSGTPSNR